MGKNEENKYFKEEDVKKIEKEAKDTIKGVKKDIKNINFSDGKEKIKVSVLSLFKRPVATIRSSLSKTNTTTTLILLIIWTLSVFIYKIFEFGNNVAIGLLSLILALVTPLLSVTILSGAIYVVCKNYKKKLISVINTITLASIPLILSSIIKLLGVGVTLNLGIKEAVFNLALMITSVLVFITVREMLPEETESKIIKYYVIIQTLFVMCYFLFSLIGIKLI